MTTSRRTWRALGHLSIPDRGQLAQAQMRRATGRFAVRDMQAAEGGWQPAGHQIALAKVFYVKMPYQVARELSDICGSPPTPITFVVAFPRGGGRGPAMMRGLEELLDAAGEPAVLTARTTSLIEFYERHGFRSQPGRRSPPDAPSPRPGKTA
jgi:GNAT superfamily N-acetyltransferase